MGHEYSGTVIDVGAEVTKVKIGDRVCVDVSYGCIEQNQKTPCTACQNDSPNACARLCLRGLSAASGGLCQTSVVPDRAVHVLPDNVPLDIGAMVQPVSISWHAVRISGIKPGQTALVLGAGPIGIAVILALLGHGASKIIVSEPAKIRRDQALSIGATHVLDPFSYKGGTPEIVEAVYKITGEGVDFAYDCSGIQSTLDTALDSLAFRGTAVNLAIWPHEKTATILPMKLTARERRYMGSMGLTGLDMDQVIAAFADGSMPMDKARAMITSKIHIDDAVDDGFHQLLNNKDQHIKILIAPGGHRDGVTKNEIAEHLPKGIDVLTWQAQWNTTGA
jgi:(R,R)-butanediol dehydrogenase/meso-butanediol dehydrogenase/diacetyl reductase